MINADIVLKINLTDGVSGTLASYASTSSARPYWYSNQYKVYFSRRKVFRIIDGFVDSNTSIIFRKSKG